MAAPLLFLFDYVSPYAYLASTRVRDMAARHGRVVEAVPVLFAGLLSASGALGPAEIPAKRDYMFRDIVRVARSLGVPIAPPAAHPFNPLSALRATLCVTDPEVRWAFVDRLYRAAWVLGERLESLEVIGAAAEEVGAPADIAAALGAPEAKAALHKTTEDAVARGVFGVPTTIVDGDMFWGVDSLPHLDRRLSGERVPDEDTIARFRAVVPSATRTGRTHK